MTSVEPLLTPIRERLQAATLGPWRWDENFGDEGDTGLALTNDAGAEIVSAYNHHCCSFRDDPLVEDNDAEFIASAPTDMARLLAAVQAVTALHQPQEEDQLWCILDEECEECYPESGEGTGHAMTVCSECRAKVDDVTGFIRWPCPTVAAITAALGGKGNDV